MSVVDWITTCGESGAKGKTLNIPGRQIETDSEGRNEDRAGSGVGYRDEDGDRRLGEQNIGRGERQSRRGGVDPGATLGVVVPGGAGDGGEGGEAGHQPRGGVKPRKA